MTIVLFNGRIYVQDPAYPNATAIAIRGETVLAVGSDAELENLVRPGDQRIDLHGRRVIPGLVDAHVHLHWLAQTLQWVNLHGTSSKADAVQRVRDRVEITPKGQWVQGRGWDQNLWPDRAFPTAADLDQIAPEHPVFLIAKSGHGAWANSLALKLAQVAPDRPNPAGGEFQRDAAGNLTGILLEDAMEVVREVIGEPPVAEAADAMAQAIPLLQAAGLTGVHCMDGGIALQAIQKLHRDGQLNFRVVKYLPKDYLDEAIGLGMRSGDGDDWLRIGGLKLFADGALGVRTATMLEPYEGEPDNYGIATLVPDELGEIGRTASAAGLSLAVHAIGDRANRMVIEQLEQLPRPTAVAQRIEHAQLLHPDDFGRMAAHDIVASMQPIHATSDIDMAERHWGERTRASYAWKTMLDKGVRLALGSDTPVEPYEPWLGIHAAVTRRRLDGSPGPEGWHPEQRLSLAQTLAGFTLGPTQTVGMAHKLGTLAPGKLADLIVLDRDILAIDPMEIPETQVQGTMIGGRWVKALD